MKMTVNLLRFCVIVIVISCVCKVSVLCVSFEDILGGADIIHFKYSRDTLIFLQTVTVPTCFDTVPDELKRNDDDRTDRQRKRRRGCRGGVMRRLRRNKTRPPLPSMILANVRSIRPNGSNNNFDELELNSRFMTEYRDSCLLCFTETWLCNKIGNDSVVLDGFGTPFRTDRDSTVTGKQQGGGVCLYVNQNWCSRASITVRKQLCTPDVELLSVSLRPKYLPREFGQLFITVCYVPPSASAARAASEIADVVRSLQLISPDSPCFVVGDFNHCDLRTCLPSFKQYVNCPTRKQKTLDLCYGNIPHAYKSVALPPNGSSDHDTIHLIPSYKPKIQTDPVVKKRVKVWTTESVEELKGCFECTDWNILIDACDNVSDATDVISSYISFCEDTIIPQKEIKIFPNNKPWVTKSLKSTLNEKKLVFQTGNKVERKSVQVKLRQEIRDSKKSV